MRQEQEGKEFSPKQDTRRNGKRHTKQNDERSNKQAKWQ